MAFVERSGVKLFYTIEGKDGAPFLMLSNSLGTTHRMWDAQMAAFAVKFRVIRYDRRGHGQSDSPPGPYSLEDLGNDALAIMEVAGAKKVNWCGLSMGGMTGLWLASNHPDRIEKLVVSSAATFMPPPELWNGRIKTAQDKGMEVLAAPTMQRWFTADFIRNSQDKVAVIRTQFLETTVDGFSGCAAAMRDMDLREIVKTIKAPTLVIVGSDDQGTTPAEAGIIVNRVPDSRGIILKGSHIINVEKPEAFTKDVLEFLS
jgi:3-oxoadipate enol-lactonase